MKKNNLHLVGYSEPVETVMNLESLQEHLHSLPEQPTAVPYVTSYYSSQWGFCIAHRDRESLRPGNYKVVIRSRLFPGFLNFGQILIPGESKRELLFSTYICHPSMANNELSGPVLATRLAKHLSSRQNFYSYRIIFIPETIGSLIFLSENIDDLRRNLLAGFVLTCVGDERCYSYIPSRNGNSVADRLALEVTSVLGLNPVKYSWLDRGSDERQYCSPGADLPVCSLIRSKYGTYPEYHTSLDILGEVVTDKGLEESYELYKTLIDLVEMKRYPRSLNVGEPQLGKRGLYPNTSIKGATNPVRNLMNFLSYADGTYSMEEIAEKLSLSVHEVAGISEVLTDNNLISW